MLNSLSRCASVSTVSTVFVSYRRVNFAPGIVFVAVCLILIIITTGLVERAGLFGHDSSRTAGGIFFVVMYQLLVTFYELDQGLVNGDSMFLLYKQTSLAHEIAHVTAVIVGDDIKIIELEGLESCDKVLGQSFLCTPDGGRL